MNNKKTILFIATMAISLLSAKATDVFVYDTIHVTPVNSMTHLHSIVVNSESLSFNSEDGSIQDMPFSSFNYFRFHRKDVPTGIKSAKRLGLEFSFDGSNINILGSDKVTSLQLYSSDGTLIGEIAPQSSDFTYDLSALAPGIYIVRLHTQKGEANEKISKK